MAELVDAARSARAVPRRFRGQHQRPSFTNCWARRDAAAGTAPAKPVQPEAQGTHTYRIVFEPHAELFRHANEPLLLIRELKHLGELKSECNTSKLPDLSRLDPEAAYLYFVFHLTTKAAQIRRGRGF